MTALLPCPDCGRIDKVTYAPTSVGIWVGCIRCQNATPDYRNHAEAFTAWNARPKPPTPKTAQPALFQVTP